MEDLLKDIVSKLNARGHAAKEQDGYICVQFKIQQYEIQLICKLGSNFPYEFPAIYVSEETSKNIPSMPHQYTNSGICTFDQSEAIPNFNKPIDLAVEVVEKAKTIIKDGIEGQNRADYMDEFLAYWKTKQHETFQLFVDDLSTVKELYCMNGKFENIASDTFEKLKGLQESTLGWDDYDIVKGILIPTNGNILMSIPKNDIEFLKLVKKNTAAWNVLNSFIQDNICARRFFVIVAEKTGATFKIFGWMFKGPGVPNGFRKGHADLAVAFTRAKNKGKAIVINNCNQERLFTRGGDGKNMTPKKVCIIGCGSIGGYVAEALMNAGVQHFSLVDNDVLTYDNIARHYVGYSYVGHSKTNAVASKMKFHNPNIVCDTFDVNAFEFFEKNKDAVNSRDLLVIATANTPLEHYVIELINAKEIVTPTLIIWVEPYAYAGHAILINRCVDIYCELFDKDTLKYKCGVIENPEQFNKREAGCQSSYMPYSAISVKNMIYRLLEPCLKDYLVKGNSYRFTWCGRLSEARESGISIANHYDDFSDYSVEIERLD